MIRKFLGTAAVGALFVGGWPPRIWRWRSRAMLVRAAVMAA